MKPIQSLRTLARESKTNWKSLVAFELWYKLLTTLLVVPLLVLLFQFTLWLAGLSYLGNDTIRRYFTTPLVYPVLAVMLLLTTYVTLVEIFGAITGIHEAHNRRRLTAGQMMRAGSDRVMQVLRSRNVGLAIFVIFLLPFTNLLPLAGIIPTIHIPGFIMDFIWANRLLAPLFLLVSLFILWLVMQRIFMLHAFVLRQEDAKTAFVTSKRLIRRRGLRTLAGLFCFGLLGSAVVALVEIVLSAVAMGIIHFTVPPELRHYVALRAINGIVVTVSLLVTLISSVAGFLVVGLYYYDYCEKEGLAAEVRRENYPSIRKNTFRLLASATAVMLCGAVVSTLLDPSYIRSTDIFSVIVAAHRGVSANAPENSIPAFRAALEVHADQIELDVHQTKDGVVVVTHDADLNRIAGRNEYVYDLTLEQLRSYDVGSWFSPAFKDLHVATLDDVLKLCKGKISIQIELKPTGHEDHFEENVAQVVRDNGFEHDCVMASMNADCLRRVKEVAPDLETLYIMAAAGGDLSGADFADGFSIEESNISAGLVQSIHAMNKLCYVWTINTDENIPALLDAGVDGILTDDPVMIQKALLRGGMNEWIVAIVDRIYGVDSYFGLF